MSPHKRIRLAIGLVLFFLGLGTVGYDLIMKEKPDAAVVDFHLPDMSGLTICKKIRTLLTNENIKLFLFTADDQDDTREKAMQAGVDKVVVKSPDAGEIVTMVSQDLK